MRTRWPSHWARTCSPTSGARHRVDGAVDLDVSVGMDAACADLEQPERLGRERLQEWLLDLQKVAQHLLTRGAMDAHLGHRAVPALEILGQRLQAVEAVAFQRVGFHVPAASFGHPVLLWVTWPRRQWHETPVRAERGVDLADVRVVQAGAHDRGL